MLIAQVSDLHVQAEGRLVCGIVDAANMFMACVADLMQQTPLPDAVVLSGDLVDQGSRREYERLKELLAPLQMPVYLLAGNHDARETLRQCFTGPGFHYLAPCGEFLHYTADLGALRLIALDTVEPRQAGGRLCPERLAWLDARLQEQAKPTLIAMHHPPFATGIAHMDAIGLEGADAMEQIVARHGHVQAILCGHLHRPIQCRFGKTMASTCPSPAHQVALDLSAAGPERFVMEPPGYQLHLWRNQRWVTHTQWVGKYPGPYPFA